MLIAAGLIWLRFVEFDQKKKDLKSNKGIVPGMATVGVEPSAAVREFIGNVTDVDRLHEEMIHMRIQEDKVCLVFLFL